MSKYMRKTVILVKTEVTPGTDPTPTGGANAILARNLNLTPMDISYEERNNIRGFFGNFESLQTMRLARVTFEVEAQGSGTAATPTGYGPLLTACGMLETITTSVAYTPQSPGIKTATIYVNIDGVLHKLTYARGTCTFKLKANSVPVFAFEFVGLETSIADVALPTGTYTAFGTPLVANLTNTTPVTLHGISSLALESFELDIGNVNEHIVRIGTGNDTIQHTDRKSKGKILFEMQSVATKDWYAAIRAGTIAAFTLTHGTVAGSKVTVAGSQVQLENPSISEIQGIQMLGMDLRFNPSNAGNDDWTITTA